MGFASSSFQLIVILWVISLAFLTSAVFGYTDCICHQAICSIISLQPLATPLFCLLQQFPLAAAFFRLSVSCSSASSFLRLCDQCLWRNWDTQLKASQWQLSQPLLEASQAPHNSSMWWFFNCGFRTHQWIVTQCLVIYKTDRLGYMHQGLNKLLLGRYLITIIAIWHS